MASSDALKKLAHTEYDKNEKSCEKCWRASAKRVANAQRVDQVMNVGFLNLAKKISLTWIAKAAKDESH